MNIAVTIWNQRAVPVFDVARDILLVDVVPGQWGEAQKEPLAGELPVQKALRLAEPGDDRQICGAISRPVLAMVRGYGIRVIPYVAGDPIEVIQAWCRGTLEGDAFIMPGRRRRGRRQHYGRNSGAKEEMPMNGVFPVSPENAPSAAAS